MAEKELTDQQVINMLGIIANKHGATLNDVNFETHEVEMDCPEENKTAVAERL